MSLSLRTLALGALLLFAAGCGSGALAEQSCQTTCECSRTDAPIACEHGGEWTCGAGGRCGYECKGQCKDLPFTCRSEESCNGTLCSEHHAQCR